MISIIGIGNCSDLLYNMGATRCVEIIFRVIAILASGGAFVGALFTELKLKELTTNTGDTDDVKRRFRQTAILGASLLANPQIDPNTLYLRTEVTAGLVFATTGIAVVIGIVSLIGRLYNVKHDKGTSRVFFFLDMLYVGICFLGFCAAGVLGVFPAMDWSQILSNINSFVIIDPFNLLQSTIVFFKSILNSLAATTACSLFAALMYGILAVIMLILCASVKDYKLRKTDLENTLLLS